MLLSHIASVRAGVAFREAITHVEEGPLAVVQAGNIRDGGLAVDELVRVGGLPTKVPQPLSPGDVVLQCRGLTYRAAVVPAHDVPLFATASVLVLTPMAAVRPDYLATFLNDPKTQGELRKLATGATIANLKRSAVEQLEVPVPTLTDQERICALGRTLSELSRIEARISELRRAELRALIERCARKNRKRVSASGSNRPG